MYNINLNCTLYTTVCTMFYVEKKIKPRMKEIEGLYRLPYSF